MTSNRIQPEFLGKKDLKKRRFSVPDTVAESFEWFASGGSKARTSEIPVFLGVLSVFAIAMISLPSLIFMLLNRDLSREILITEGASDLNFDAFDIIRASHIFGFGILSGSIAMALLHFVLSLMKMARRRDQSIQPSTQKTLDTIKFLSPYISISFMAVVMSAMVRVYYPKSLGLGSAIATPETGKGKTETTSVDNILNLLVAFLDKVLTFGGKDPTFQFKIIFPAVINTITVFIFVLTVEKFILQMIAISYRSTSTAGRFSENAFALSAIKGLLRTKLEMTGELKPGRTFDSDLTDSLFDSLATGNGEEEGGAFEVLKLKHLEDCMYRDQATKLFNILDIAQNGDLTKEEFNLAIKSVYDEQEILIKLVSDHDDIIAKLDEIMLFGAYSIDAAFCLTFLGIGGVELLKSFFGILVAFGLVFSDALKKVFDALIFVLVTHPYDLGDRVEIDKKYLYVESVGLWTTIFNGPGGLKTIMTNASLADEKIANFRRSPAENEMFSYLVRPETVTDEAVEALKKDCVQFFKDNNRDFLPNWHLESVDQIDSERFKIFIKVFHRHNFQNEEAKNERSQKFALYFKDALIRNGFHFSPAYPKVLAAAL